MEKGKVLKRTSCRICEAKEMEVFLDLGYMPHAGDYLKKNVVGKELYYPLKIYRCKKCNLIQILDVIPQSVLFEDYHYLSSVSLSEHFKRYANEMRTKYLKKNSFVVEIGSNDGVLLYPLMKMGVKVLGVDPSANVAKEAKKRGIKTIVKGFTVNVAKNILETDGKVDAIFANNVLAHIDDIKNVFCGIKKLLKNNGVFVAEFHYFPDLLEKLQYDFFYNEHLSYYTLKTFSKLLDQYNLVPFDVKEISIHSGSLRVYSKFRNNDKYKITKRLKKLKEKESLMNKQMLKKMSKFKTEVENHKKCLNEFVDKLNSNGEKLVGYGASGRANTLLNYCGITGDKLKYIVDESPERFDRYTPGTHIPIVSVETFRKDKDVRYSILFAWNYKREIIAKEKEFLRRGGKFIIPFPKVAECK